MVNEQTLKYESENIYTRFSKPITLLLIISPILSTYKIVGMSFGIVCLLVSFFAVIIIEGKIKMKWPKYFWIYFIYIILTRILFASEFSITNIFSFSLVSFGILLGCSGRYFNLKYGIRIYKISVLCCCIFFFIQELSYHLIGSRPIGLLPILPLDIYGNESFGEIILRLSYSARSSSFFSEPSYFSEYLLPLLALELFNTQNKRFINFNAILISVVLLLLQSGLGLLIMVLLWIVWFFLNLRRSDLYKKILVIFILIPFAVISSIYFINSEIGKGVLARTDEFGTVDATTSTYVRMIRGYDLYSEFPIFNKIFGLNSSYKLQSQISVSSMYRLFQDDDLSFNCIQSILIYGGIFGMLLFSLHFFYLFKMNGIEGRMIAVVFVCLSVIASIYLKQTMLVCYSIMFAFQKQFIDGLKNNKDTIIQPL